MAKFYCKCCGFAYSSVATLVNGGCSMSPTGHHILYEGSEKSKYACKYCGATYSSMMSLVQSGCTRSPTGHHSPAM